MLKFEKKPTQTQINNNNAKTFIAELIKCGVRHFCIGSGKRSIILANAISLNPLAKLYTHFDERSLGFFALGVAKTQPEPVAILVTSASAVANLYPSIIEAKMSHHSLIVLAANRPNELADLSANQTIDQNKMFSHFVQKEINLNFSDASIEEQVFKSSASRLYHLAQTNDISLINAAFCEPLECITTESKLTYEPTICSYPQIKKILTDETINSIAYLINNASAPLIIAAETKESNDLVLELALKLQAPAFLDILSNLRNNTEHPCNIPFYEQIIKSKKTGKYINPDLVLHFGKRPISKELLNHLHPEHYIHIDVSNDRIDPNNVVTQRLCTTPNTFCLQMMPHITAKEKTTTLMELKSLSLKAKNHFYELIHTYKEIDELYFFYTLMNHPIDEYNLFFANSMPIRYADALFFACSNLAKIYANRGCSGIDGNVASALGIHSQSMSPSICVLGDLTTLYDFNAFMMEHKNENPILFVVFNNQQGGIFHHQDCGLEEKSLEKFVSLKHEMSFETLAKAFNLQYFCPDLRDNFESDLICALNSQFALLEIKVDAKTSANRYSQIFNKIEKTLATI